MFAFNNFFFDYISSRYTNGWYTTTVFIGLCLDVTIMYDYDYSEKIKELNFNEKLKNNDLRRFLTNVLIVLIIFNLSYNFLNIFTSDFMYIGLIETRPYLFWKIYYMIHFWL